MRKPNKKVREGAILILRCAADLQYPCSSVYVAARDLGMQGTPAERLARRAFLMSPGCHLEAARELEEGKYEYA